MIRLCTIYLLVFVGIAIPQKWASWSNAANSEGTGSTGPFPFNIYLDNVNVFNKPNVYNLGNSPKLNKNTWNDKHQFISAWSKYKHARCKIFPVSFKLQSRKYKSVRQGVI